MKIKIKTTYLILGIALTLSSCSQEDIPCIRPTVGSERLITFRSSLPEITTRAKDISDSDLTYFRVTAFEPEESDSIKDGILCEYIKNDTLFWNDENTRFISEDCLWPETGKEEHVLHFFAYYPHLPSEASFANNTEVEDGQAKFDYKIGNFKVAPSISDHIDFLTAYASGSMEDKLFSGVNLEFKHKLSRIEVRAKSNNKSCNLEIAGVRIGSLFSQATYNFKAEDDAGDWTIDETQEKKVVEYIYRPGDKIVALINPTENNPTDAESVSIMGGPDGINYAMLLPNEYDTSWDFANDHINANKGLYLSVLLRVIDKTTENNQTPDKNSNLQKYPYLDNTQGLDAKNMPRVYLAVDKDGNVTDHPGQLYKDENGKYYTDEAKRTEYKDPNGGVVKEFGWAAVPITGSWEAGYSYTYTLDYSSGVGLHDPEVKDPDVADPEVYSHTLKAGDPIISDKIGVSVSVKGWQTDEDENEVNVPGS